MWHLLPLLLLWIVMLFYCDTCYHCYFVYCDAILLWHLLPLLLLWIVMLLYCDTCYHCYFVYCDAILLWHLLPLLLLCIVILFYCDTCYHCYFVYCDAILLWHLLPLLLYVLWCYFIVTPATIVTLCIVMLHCTSTICIHVHGSKIVCITIITIPLCIPVVPIYSYCYSLIMLSLRDLAYCHQQKWA